MTEHPHRPLQNWRLKVLEEAAARGNMAKTCRHYGISREIFYRWRRRYQSEGLAGLRDRSHAPRYCPRMTNLEIVAKVLYLRQHYHMGPWRIRMYLLRYYEIVIADQTVYRILRRIKQFLNGVVRYAIPHAIPHTGVTRRFSERS
jgi:transposase